MIRSKKKARKVTTRKRKTRKEKSGKRNVTSFRINWIINVKIKYALRYFLPF